MIKTILTITVLMLFSVSLKSQNKTFGKTENLNSDSVIENIQGIQLQKYLIKKDQHSPRNRRFLLHTSREFAIVCMFDSTCVYSFPDSNAQLAINKIFGYSFGSNHHNNSFRIGWRCRDSVIEVLAYWYIRHQRFNNLLFVIEPGKRFFIQAAMDCEKVRINYLIEDLEPEYKEVFYNPEKYSLKKWGYVNYPYFGGRKKSPHNMMIYLKAWIFD